MVRTDPGFAGACNPLAWLFATAEAPELRNPAEALRWSARTLELRGSGDANALDTRAAALAAAGRFSEAVRDAERACDIAVAQHDETLARSIRDRARFYRSGRPFVEARATVPRQFPA